MGRPVDFVIVTALEEERDAVLSKLPSHQILPPTDDDVRVYYSATLPNDLGSSYSIIVVPLLGMGRVEAANATHDALRAWQPRNVLLVGIAGGVAKRGVQLGDVLLSEQIVDYELQKLTDAGAEVRWLVHRADPRLLGRAKALPLKRWRDRVAIGRPVPSGEPTRHVGPIASGDKVAAVSDFLQQHRTHWPALVGIEMEAAGVANACFTSSVRPAFFMVRGVSDLADANKDHADTHAWRQYACDVAASYLIALIESGPTTASSRALLAKTTSESPPSHSEALYPVHLVNELETLLRKRHDPDPAEPPSIAEDRQARIDQIVTDLKSYGSPGRDDEVVGTRLVRILGKGNFGVVWESVDIASGATRATKIFDSDRLGLTQSLYQFRRGVRAMQHLNHAPRRPDSVVRLYQVDATQLAFAMEFLEGRDLTNIARRGWSLEKKLAIARTLCTAVAFAHDNGVLHRDIKPANIVMSKHDEPVLTDFDIADLLFVKTASAQAAGTAFYAAPEQLAGKGRKEFNCDVYSLGRLLHFLLIDRDPDFLFEEIPTLRDLAVQPEGLVRIIRRCTLRAPDARYSTVLELFGDLERHDRDPGGVGVGIEGPQTSRTIAVRAWQDATRSAAKGNWIAAAESGEAALAMIRGDDAALFAQWMGEYLTWKAKTGATQRMASALPRLTFGLVTVALATTLTIVVARVGLPGVVPYLAAIFASIGAGAMAARFTSISQSVREYVPATIDALTSELYARMIEHNVVHDLAAWKLRPSPRRVLQHRTLAAFCDGRIKVERSQKVSITYGGPPYRLSRPKYEMNKRDYAALRDELIASLKRRGMTIGDYLANSRSERDLSNVDSRPELSVGTADERNTERSRRKR